jgi:hypothetical protein
VTALFTPYLQNIDAAAFHVVLYARYTRTDYKLIACVSNWRPLTLFPEYHGRIVPYFMKWADRARAPTVSSVTFKALMASSDMDCWHSVLNEEAKAELGGRLMSCQVRSEVSE